VRDQVAQQRYQQRHIEPGLPRLHCEQALWKHVLVIPAYRESADLLQTLAELARETDSFLTIVVLNRPDRDLDPEANQLLREAIETLPSAPGPDFAGALYTLPGRSSLLLYDTESNLGPLPSAGGVGLARKIGCDIAWQWIRDGAISGDWIHSSDADARLPADYFERTAGCEPGIVAATYPFLHVPGPDPETNEATTLYELRLHHYVLGLEYAGSPYAHHSLGSCLAVRAGAYAKVRGFPRRAGGEDFYLLNKLAKLGPINRLVGECIELQSRQSHRVPFGTGPAVARIADGAASPALFYHPGCFAALRALLQSVPALYQSRSSAMTERLCAEGLSDSLAAECNAVLEELGWQQALAHCTRQARDSAQFLRQFHQWFDAFRTLKFIHALRDRILPQQTLPELDSLQPALWPERGGKMSLSEAIRDHWRWVRRNPERW
jgi:hypothetical protein